MCVFEALDYGLAVCGYMLCSAVATPKSICELRDADDALLVVSGQSALVLFHASAKASPAVACRLCTFLIKCVIPSIGVWMFCSKCRRVVEKKCRKRGGSRRILVIE
jgi:hypothetical protein